MVNLRRKLAGKTTIAAAASVTQKLEREHFYRQLHLELWYESADPGSGVANANLTIHDFLTSISIKLGGTTVPFSMSGLSLALLNQFDNGMTGNDIKGAITQALHAVGDGNVTDGQDVQNIAHYWIDFNLAPTDQRWMLPSGELASFDLILQSVAAISGAGNLWTTAMDTEPTFRYRLTSWEKVTAAISPAAMGLIFRREFTKALGTGTGEIEVELPLGNIYRRMLVYLKDANGKVVSLQQSDNVTNANWSGNTTVLPASEYRIEINGIEVVEKRDISEACIDDHFQYGLIPGLPYGAPAVDSFGVNAQNHVACAWMIDFDLDIANLDDALDSANFSSFKIIFNGTATDGTVIVVTEELRPPA